MRTQLISAKLATSLPAIALLNKLFLCSRAN